MDEAVERKERTYIRLILGSLIGFVLLIFLCWGAYRLVNHFQALRMARRGSAYLSGGDLRSASLSARRSLQLERNPEAMRLLAQVLERSNDKAALEWRRQVLEMEPRSIADIVAFASTALQFGETKKAEQIINGLDVNQHQTGSVEAIRARIAEAKGKMKDAEQHWLRACALDPNDKTLELGLAFAQLKIDDAGSQKAGRQRLEKLRGDEKQRAAATRVLIADTILHHRDLESAKILAQQLQEYPESRFADRLLYLELLRTTKDGGFAAYLTKVENDAASSPTNLAALISWMNKSGMALVALDYVHGIDKANWSKWPVPSELVNSYLRLADWKGLERFTEESHWPQFDFIRRAYLARALREQDKDELALREWTTAEKEASIDPKYIEVLERTAVEWGWKAEAVELLWQLAKAPDKQAEALESLYKHYAEENDSDGLYRVLTRLLELKPTDRAVRNNFAQIALLLHADTARAYKIAADLHREEPANGVFASTYAFALYDEGKVAQALKVMNSLTADQFQDPGTSAYFGIFLAADGKTEKAAKYLEMGKAAHLLPEEKALFDRAQQTLK